MTITSQLNINDKVTKIKKSLFDKNTKLLEYVAEILSKVYTDAVETIVLFVMNLEAVERKQLVVFAEEAIEDINQLERLKISGKSVGLINNVASLRILENLNGCLSEINEGRIK